MGRLPDFIGLGAQRSGTSWLYACLYEHPALCLPRKEVHFFSRERFWARGREWYEAQFDRCPHGALAGEFSTSYLFSPKAPERIKDVCPDARLIAILRHPVERALSNFRNDIMAGTVQKGTSFGEALTSHPEYVEQGRYASQLRRYVARFPRQRLRILIYEEAVADPDAHIRDLYEFLGVDPTFRPRHLHKNVNRGREPRAVWADRVLNNAARGVRHAGLDTLWWLAKKSGIGQGLRRLNTASEDGSRSTEADRCRIWKLVEDEVVDLEDLLGRPPPWSAPVGSHP